MPAALSTEESARIAESVLGVDVLPVDLRSLVATKAEGNPFYTEELVRSLEESGALRRMEGRLALTRPLSQVAIPGTVQDVIAARIDRLAEAPKLTLQLASVIGREFSRRLVDRVSQIGEGTDGALRELSALELIHERRRLPELAYAFKHALTQDVAYASLLVQRRGELHRLVGIAIEELYDDRLPELYEVLAHHFSHTDDAARALAYLVRAAEKATQAFGLRQAIDLYGEALAAAARLEDRAPATTVMAIHAARADLFFGVGDFERSREAAETVVDLARHVQDRPAEANALIQCASALQWAEDFPAALERAQEGIELAETAGAQRPLAGGLYVRGYVHAVSGRLDAAKDDVARALAIGRAVGDPARQALALHILAMHSAWQGDYRASLELAGEGVRLAREHRLVVPLLRCFWNQGAALNDAGEYDAGLAALTEGLALAERIGDDAFIPRFQGRRLDDSRGPRERGRRAGGVEPHRPAPSAVPLDDVALRDALSRERGPARAAAGRSRPRAPARRAEPRARRADAFAQVRGLGVADQGRERHRATGVGRGGRGAAALVRPRGGDRSAAPDLAEPRRARTARRGARPAG